MFIKYAVQQAMDHLATLDAAIKTTIQATPETAPLAQLTATVVLLIQL